MRTRPQGEGMPWHEVRLTPAQAAENERGRVQEQIWASLRGAGAPQGRAMASAWGWDDQPSLQLYSSPQTEEHAAAFLRGARAQPCEPPSIVEGLDARPADALQRFRQRQL
jgi:hypothetical protein